MRARVITLVAIMQQKVSINTWNVPHDTQPTTPKERGAADTPHSPAYQCPYISPVHSMRIHAPGKRPRMLE